MNCVQLHVLRDEASREQLVYRASKWGPELRAEMAAAPLVRA